MFNKYKKIILSLILIVVGFADFLFVNIFPKNIFGLFFLMILNVSKFGGIILLITSLFKVFYKEKKEEHSSLHHTLKGNNLFMAFLFFLVLGVIFCFSTFLLPYLCNIKDPICPVASVGISFLFFIPIGIVFLIMSASKLFKFIKNKKC